MLHFALRSESVYVCVWFKNYHNLLYFSLILPQCARANKVHVYSSLLCVCVCVYVCLSVTGISAPRVKFKCWYMLLCVYYLGLCCMKLYYKIKGF